MSSRARISSNWFWVLAPFLAFAACSGGGSAVNTNESSLPHGNAGQPSSPGSSGSGGGSGGMTAVSSAGMSNIAGASGQAGAIAVAGADSGAAAGNASPSSAGAAGTGVGGTTGSSGASFGGAGGGNAGRAGASGGGGSAGSSAAFTQVGMVLAKSCGIQGCHADKQAPHFVPGSMLYATLTGPSTVIASCGYTKLVEAGDPAKSALVRLMNRQCDGFVMPPGCNKTPCISSADLKVLSDWIQAGAPP